MFRERNIPILLFCFVVLICTAVLQYLNPDYRFYDGGLVTVILLTIFLKDDRYTRWFGMISLLLIIISGFYPHLEIGPEQVILQHTFSGLILFMTILLVLYVKRLYKNIESEERQVNALFQYATEGIILTDKKGQMVLVNPAAESLFGYDPDELLGEPIEKLIPSRYHANHSNHREGYYQSPSFKKMGVNRELYAIRKNGDEFPVEVSLSHYEQDNAFFVIAFVIDITQRKETEYKILQQKDELEKITNDMRKLNADLENKVQKRTMILQEALQQLEQSREELSQALSKERELSEIKSRFVSMASHEFRTPLSTVLSSASLLSKYTLSEQQENREKHIRRIKDSVKHLNDLLEDFLSLGKLEENKIDVQSAPFEVASFLDEVLEEIRVVLKKDQQIIPVYSGGVRFTTDKRLLKNILINLLTNASKFSEEGKSIYLSADTGLERLEVKIKDEGIGIADDDQVHLFSSFYRGKNAVNIQGTGLGLHIVKRYSELLEGAIFLKSVLGQGTEVVLSLPLLPESADEGKKTFYSY